MVQDVAAAPKVLRLLVGIFSVVIVVSVVGGAASGLVGRGLIGFGERVGGILGVSVPVLVVLVVAIGFVAGAHAVDPFANGWWDGRSRIGSQPLCERFGPELN
ncbi:MAG: hypothetical protein P8Q52_01900 [Acidimicrobiales bacterium]|nr:hypothetical protein [Acidimicrobiales bacterium]